MNKQSQLLLLVFFALALGGCATSSVKHSWKSPVWQGSPLQKISVLAVDERELVRNALENVFVREFRNKGQEAMATHELLGLSQIKTDKQAAAARLRTAGADAMLLIRLVDDTTYSRQVPTLYVTPVAGYGTHDWYDYYLLVHSDMGVKRGTSIQDKVYLDSSLFDLKTGQCLWSALTLTVLNESMDRLQEADSLATLIVKTMGKDGLIR